MFKDDDQKLIDLIWEELDCPKEKPARTLIFGLEKKMAANDFTLDLIKDFINILRDETAEKFPDEWAEIKKEIFETLN